MPIYQGVSLQRLEEQELRNVFYYESTAVLTSSQLQEATDGFYDAYEAFQLLHALTVDWDTYGMEWRRVDVPSLPTLLFNYTQGVQAGEDTSNAPLPTQVAMLLTARANTVFPRNARTYQGGFHVSSVDGRAFFTQNAVDAGNAFLGLILTVATTGDTLRRVAVQWEDNPQNDHVVVDWNELEVFSAKGNPVIQRRRRQGTGI